MPQQQRSPADLIRKAAGLGRLLASPQARRNTLHEWRRRTRGEPSLPEGSIRNVLVVCQGNICRSPFAGGLLATLNPALGVRSAGLAAGAGAPADPAAIRAAAAFGVDLMPHEARPLAAEDVVWADLVLGMEGHHVIRIRRRWQEASRKTRVLGDFLPESPHVIHDPWGREDSVFAETFRRIAAAVRRVAQLLEAKGPWPPSGG